MSRSPKETSFPHSLEAEQGLLGSILIDPKHTLETCVTRKVGASHFHIPAHATIYAVLLECWNESLPIDLIVLTETLRSRSLLDKVGGAAAVTGLFTLVPTAALAGSYIDLLEEKRILREIIATGREFTDRAQKEQETPEALFAEFQSRATRIGETLVAEHSGCIRDDVHAALGAIEALYERKGEISGVPTGLKDFDILTDGFKAGDMVVVAGRPGSGKTSLGMNVAEHVAVNLKRPVGVFSLEMSRQQLVQRLILSRAKVNWQHVRDGVIKEHSFTALHQSAEAIATAPLYIDDLSGLTIQEIRARSRRWKREHQIQLLVIDYLQLVESANRHHSDEAKVAEISRNVKLIAKEIDIPVIVLAQLNRNPEGRKDGRPRVADLRQSGSIEQDADLIALVHRKDQYSDGETEATGESVLIVGKHRNGPVGDIPLTFLAPYARFESRAWNEGEQE